MKWKLKLATVLFLTLAVFASGDLKNILKNATGETEVYVAAGSYSPGVLSTDSFILSKDVKLFGGFAGTETKSTDRDWVKNPTILKSNDVAGQQNYHIVMCSGDTSDTTKRPTSADTRLDGFIITGGKANGSSTANGGGMYNNYASPAIENCTFSGNTASIFGGGMYNAGSSPAITNTIFWGNTASSGGSSIYQDGGTATLKNCVVPTGGTAKSSGTITKTAAPETRVPRGQSRQCRTLIVGRGAQYYNSDNVARRKIHNRRP